MTDLEKAIVAELRLSNASATNLLPTIQRNINTARSELIRTGVSPVLANSSHALIEDAIICFCLSKMGDNKAEREEYCENFKDQCDNLRKSTIEVPSEEETDNEEEEEADDDE